MPANWPVPSGSGPAAGGMIDVLSRRDAACVTSVAVEPVEAKDHTMRRPRLATCLTALLGTALLLTAAAKAVEPPTLEAIQANRRQQSPCTCTPWTGYRPWSRVTVGARRQL